ncbi:TonB-dependent receptor plug domain-containing protein [Shewanella intestini]|uniref:TonB-dependent receptor n=1 Tax=Shewanella intestini TaxID=2017544 RepID=A0ABS5I026_9GAMM|nr:MULTISPECIES: TonB-dependent receptor plug domain-containing protein [Shewanella]MBR9727388.1 TonB-dependent receptor [Shewanella intestini]MRG35562.1 TonB-dependent receptor [Shewanella sp. XMDDZSB0408]
MKTAVIYSYLTTSILTALYASSVIASDDLPTLAETEVQSQNQEQSEHLVLDHEHIQQTPVANNSLSQLLKTQPGIAINDGTGSVRGGDIAPEEISIANARTHQTNYMIGGVSTNNVSTFADRDTAGGLGGHTSGYFFDTTLLDSVEVMDRNISAEYGGFTGGVVNAQLRKPTKDFTADYQFKMTDSDWNEDPKIDEDNSDLESPIWGDGRYQDRYQKRFHNLFVGGAINDNHQLGFGMSINESDIPLIYNGERKDQTQTNTNLFLNHNAQLGEWELSNELRYSQFTEDRFLNDTFDDSTAELSDYQNSHSGMGITVKLDRQFSQGMWRNSVAFDQLKDERSADVDYFKTHLDFRDGFNFNSSGSYGNLDQTQNSTQIKTAFDFDSIYTGDVRQQISIGAQATLISATGRFHNDFHTFTQTSNANDTVKLTSWTTTQAGNYDAESNQYALFVTNQLDWQQLNVNLGLRAEHIELFDQTVLAPRVSASWDFDNQQLNRVTAGVSRYYSGSLLGWALKAQKRGMQVNRQNCMGTGGGNDISLNPNDYTCESETQYQVSDMNQADTPYSDEFALNYDRQVSNVEMNLGYLFRSQRDGLSVIYNSDLSRDELHNNMQSDSNIYTLRLSNVENYKVLGAEVGGYINVGYTDATGSGSTSAVYDDQNDLNGGSGTEWVMLDGELMRRTDMDTGSYNSDLTAAFGLNTAWPQYGVVWNNLLNYEGGRTLTLLQGQQSEEINGEPTSVAVLSSAEMQSLLTWDSKLTWTPHIANEHLTLGVSVTNLLNEQVKIATSGIADNSAFTDDYYSKGREFWLTVGVKM